jgi:homoserine O-acetyltransferase
MLKLTVVAMLSTAAALHAASYPAPAVADWLVHDFRFHDGSTLPELKLHYLTIGAATGEPILLLHGSTQNSGSFLTDAFAGQLFGPGQPLDASTHYLILPDGIGAGESSRPSVGLRAKFPSYTYEDIVSAQYRLVFEHLNVKHLRLIIGNSAGGMQTWLWGEMYPDFMDALVPLASMPIEMSGRNWMMRRLLIDSIRSDPGWKNGNYEKQPSGFIHAYIMFSVATNGGTEALARAYPTRQKADAYIDQRLAAAAGDANDVLYQYEASRDYNPSPKLETIQAAVLAINSADDERNPVELGVMERQIRRLKHGRYVLIPAGEETHGHGTVANAALWRNHLAEFLGQVPKAH